MEDLTLPVGPYKRWPTHHRSHYISIRCINIHHETVNFRYSRDIGKVSEIIMHCSLLNVMCDYRFPIVQSVGGDAGHAAARWN